MNFSKGVVTSNKESVQINFRYRRNKSTEIEIPKSDFQEYSYFKEQSKVRLKNWLIVLIHVGLIVLYVYVRSLLEDYGLNKDSLATLDIIFIPLLTLLIVLLMVEILGEFRFLRRLYSFLLTRRKRFLRIVLKSGKSFKIPVKNEKEAIQIVDLFVQE